jgi:electron transport complex protein RnfC
VTTSSRTSSAPSPAATWPGAIPEFEALPAGPVLWVPCSPATNGRPLPRHVDAAEPIAAGVDPKRSPLAPAAGMLEAIEPVRLFDERSTPAARLRVDDPAHVDAPPVPIEGDDGAKQLDALHRGDLPAWAERLRDAGIWTDRRGSPDLIGQLQLAMRRPVDTVLCSLLDADASVCLNAALAARYPRELVAGVNVLSRLTASRNTWIVADERVPGTWIGHVRRLVRKTGTRLLSIANDYPQADPTLLMYTLLSRRLRPGRLPVEQGALLLDAAAAVAVGRAAILAEPMLRVPLVVRDHPTSRTFFVFAPIGTPLSAVLEGLSLPTGAGVYRGGDVLRDLRLGARCVVSGSELTLHASAPEPPVNPDPCIRCGWCIEACPTRVQPAVVLEAAQREDLDLAERAGLEACIDCGICSYVCPSKLPLLQGTRVMKRKSAEVAGEVEPVSS